ncbi:c6f6d12f-e701-467a-b78e-6bacf3edbbe0 [Thermothielavioides terrestris]|uniref:C6f6d12f-e701-467a-b78e-6bacf3edbbe0 n=1 Tax=Thermothielavioides terrestris TaxID=2587410 RepID=A0A3S4D8M6_9PEZI|nr:c6f6d12f-e701-467a-b78e-6bacf3edbbe0 [Thermothielavioides terrestris]
MDNLQEGHEPVSRPSTACKIDPDDDAASPTKQHADEKRPATDVAAVKAENIPPLHPPAAALAAPESSYLESPSMNLRHSDSQAEIIVRQHLQDIESSFSAAPSPLPASNNGLDDTFLFDSPSKKPAPPRFAPNADDSSAVDQSQVLPTLSRSTTSTPHNARESSPQLPGQDNSTDDVGNGTASLETFSSSPTAAATALKAAKRPRFLRSRIGSQRSSVSSLHTDPDSDVTVGMGADYALQSGGAVPSSGMPRSFNNPLSRSISMGSMASGIEDLHDSSGPVFRQLETLDEVDGSISPQSDSRRGPDRAILQTPKPTKAAALAAPTDTVIARHVRDVQVPESLAKEYKNRGGLVTPARPGTSDAGGFGTSTASRHGRSLTLKEQSSTIERLSKENFDLKLKVMFLSDRLDKLSEEGIKEMISENVELKTGLAVLQRDNKVLRRRVKELEKQLKDEEERPGTARSGQSDDEQSAAYDQEAQEREEELIYLREQVEEYVTEIERLRKENLNKEAEKRRMAEVVRTLGEKTGERLGEDFERQEEADVWKDLLEQETARREQSDEDNRRLRDEIFRLKQELAAHSAVGPMHHTTNIYNITKKPRDRPSSPGRSGTSVLGDADGHATLSVSSTLVEELRRESEQLRHENAELRREVGAQTSMLTSRNREKERLYQEIEDLKMAQRRGAPAPSTIDSLLERSASRAGVHERSQSRASGGTRGTNTAVDDADLEELENKLAELRDKNNDLKLQNQDLQRELNACMADFEAAIEAKRQAEELVAALQDDLETAMSDLMALQAERDEALQEHANLENEFEALRKEAQEEIDALEGEADQRTAEIERLQLDLNDRTENFDALQGEMRKMSEALVRLEDEQEAKLRRIKQLEQELSDANKELEDLEAKLLEANDKANRLSVQQESSQGEIAFLREEQESDKIRIGDLEAALANAEQSLREEKERAKELEQRLAAERRQREIVANREKEEVQQFVNELNREASAAKDEARRLRKSLTSREVEATEWKERLLELENNLREALGDLNGTRSSLLKSIAKLQRDLENTVRDLDATKSSLAEKDRMIKQRDALLESHALESRKLAEMLDKERQAHRNVKHQFETFQKTHQHITRTVSSQDQRIMELEQMKSQDKKRLSQLENTFKEQLTERNNLLLVLWTRLSALCGTDWAHDNSLINGRALPSLESVATMLPGFSKNLLAAVKTIETMVGSFQGKIKSVEKDLWREYQTLENHLEQRTKKLDRLEAIVRNGIATGQLSTHSHTLTETQARLARLEDAYRQLKIENHTLRAAAEARRAAYAASADHNGPESPGGSPSPLVPTGPKAKDRSSKIPKSGSKSSGLGKMATPTRSSSSHYHYHPHPSRQSLAAADEVAMLSRSRGGSPATPRAGGDPAATEDDDTITGSLPQPSQPQASKGGHDRERTSASAATSTAITTSTAASGTNTNNASASSNASGSTGAGGSSSGGGGSMDNKWMLRLRDLEHKLKAEREGRLLDRGEALKRLTASESENAALRENLERERERRRAAGR